MRIQRKWAMLLTVLGVLLSVSIGVPFRVKLAGLNALTDSVMGIESFRVPLGKSVGALYILGAGLIGPRTKGDGTVIGGHPEGLVSDAGLFNIELTYEDGSSEEVFPTNIRSGKREWYDWSKFSEFAIEKFAVGRNVFLYCVAPSRDVVVKEIRINDNDQEGEYGVFATTLADRRPDFLGPNPELHHPGEPLQLEPPTVLLRLKQAVGNLNAFADVSEVEPMLGKAERLVGEQKVNPTEERLKEISSLVDAALAWLDRDEVRETLRKRTDWGTFRTVDLSAHYNKSADNCFNYGYGVASGKQVGIQPP